MIENYAVILDYLNDKIAQYWDVTLPFTVFALVIAVLIFAWRSTEVNTADEINGQFTIPGRGTFNVVNSESQSAPNATVTNNSGVRLRNVNRQANNESPGQSPSSSSEPIQETREESPNVSDQGDLNEDPVHIRVRFLDESSKECSFRPSQSLSDFKEKNWSDVEERTRLCLIYGGNPLRDDSIKMSQVGLKEGDTMHGFYKTGPANPEAGSNETNNNSSQGFGNSGDTEDDDFDELARYFLPLAGSLLGMTWFYIFSSPISISMSTMVSLLFITGLYAGFVVYNYRHLIF